jgi:DNA-binding NarL/FixJ family response regulator
MKILIVDDHPLVGAAVVNMVNNMPGFYAVGPAGTCAEMEVLLDKERPLILILDVSLPDMDGLECLPKIKKNYPDLRVICHSMHEIDRYVSHAREQGAHAYVFKSQSFEMLPKAIKEVGRGMVFFPKADDQRQETEEMASHQLQTTEREKRFIQLFSEGASTREMAEDLNITQPEVHDIRKHLLRKMGVEGMHELIQMARLKKWI